MLEFKKSEIERNEVVAPVGCYVARYQVKGQKHCYWYYQLRASTAIFPKTNKFNLTKAIETLKESFLDLYSDEEKVGHRVK